MGDLDLDQPASLWWQPVPPGEMKDGVVYAGDNRQFGTVRNAVRFCMEKLDPRLRGFARIDVDSGPSINSDKIADLYEAMKGGFDSGNA